MSKAVKGDPKKDVDFDGAVQNLMRCGTDNKLKNLSLSRLVHGRRKLQHLVSDLTFYIEIRGRQSQGGQKGSRRKKNG
jgi:hypothetical protein